MKLVLCGVAAVAVVWVAAPWVCMKRHGTVDEQTLASWEFVDVPTQRRSVEDADETATPRTR